mgnify:CR=1 FL=1
MKFAYDIIKKPVITERSMMGAQDNKYTFEVAVDAGKIEIKKAVEEIFGVKVAKVNTIKLPGKWKRMGVHVGKRSSHNGCSRLRNLCSRLHTWVLRTLPVHRSVSRRES